MGQLRRKVYIAAVCAQTLSFYGHIQALSAAGQAVQKQQQASEFSLCYRQEQISLF